ncbi:MAG: RecX family transcriptional regulator [Bacteroidales bacterium]|jgi:regulatory protein|nr:RecX family transcriptional regulator [Bacteroidales bacterium]
MKQQEKIVTPEQAYARITRICARKEYAPFDIRQKLLRLNLTDDVVELLLERLIKERYIDERRYTESYIREKLHFNKWGKRKIELHLAQKRISPDVVRDVFTQFSESQLSESLLSLLEKKRKSVTGRSEYERNGKLIRYALGRGFSMQEISRCLKMMDVDSYPDEPQ